MEEERLDLWHTDNAICPYCGYEDIDSWELKVEGNNDTNHI